MKTNSHLCGDLDKVDQYIKERGNKVLVRWLGYGPEFDSWINKSDVKDYE